MTDNKVPTCGDCIHADVCARVPYFTEFSRDNPAYCKGFAADKNVGRWIPVTERLPEENTAVIVATDRGDSFQCLYAYDGWDLWEGHIINITHWMPLPEPPEED